MAKKVRAVVASSWRPARRRLLRPLARPWVSTRSTSCVLQGVQREDVNPGGLDCPSRSDSLRGPLLHLRPQDAACRDMLRKAAGVERGSSAQKRDKVGSISPPSCERSPRSKMRDLNASDVEAAEKMIDGSARSMGIEVRKHEARQEATQDSVKILEDPSLIRRGSHRSRKEDCEGEVRRDG